MHLERGGACIVCFFDLEEPLVGCPGMQGRGGDVTVVGI